MKLADKLRQYRIIQVYGLRSKIFRQVVQINQGKAVALPRFFGQADGIIFKQAVRLELCGVALSAAPDEARANMEETGQKNNTRGVRYAKSDRGYRSYQNINLNTLDNEEIKMYNDRGWAYDLLNNKDMLLLSQKIDEIYQGLYAGKLKLGDGTFLVDVNDKALIMGGTRQDPTFLLVLLANTNSYNDNLDIVKDVIYESERFRHSKEEFASFLEIAVSLYKEENLRLFKREDYQYKKGEREAGQRAEISSGFEDDIYFAKFQDRTGNNSKIQSGKADVKKRDADYLAAVERGDTEAAQRMVDEAAELAFADSKVRGEDGKLLKVYHGSDADFTVFDKTKSRAG